MGNDVSKKSADADTWMGEVFNCSNICMSTKKGSTFPSDNALNKSSAFAEMSAIDKKGKESIEPRKEMYKLRRKFENIALYKDRANSLVSALAAGNDRAKAKSLSCNSEWTSSDDVLLENAVRKVAKDKCVDVPDWKELQGTFQVGAFLDDYHLEFWLLVARQLKPKSAQECYLRFYELHGSPVARFTVTSKKNPTSKPHK